MLTNIHFQFSYQDPSSVMGGASLMSGNSLRWICQFWWNILSSSLLFQIVWCSELGIHIWYGSNILADDKRSRFQNLWQDFAASQKKRQRAKCSEKKVFSRSPSLLSTPTWPTQINLGTFLHGYLGTYPDLPTPPKPASAYKLFLVDEKASREGFLFMEEQFC